MSEVLEQLEEKVSKRNKDFILKRIEETAYNWFDGKISDRRAAERVFGLINGEAQ